MPAVARPAMPRSQKKLLPRPKGEPHWPLLKGGGLHIDHPTLGVRVIVVAGDQCPASCRFGGPDGHLEYTVSRATDCCTALPPELPVSPRSILT
jgi:hypothetical protein